MKFGKDFQFECPDKCPEDCVFIKTGMMNQGGICSRCPVFTCAPPTSAEEALHKPLLKPEKYRSDWGKEWDNFFKTKEIPELKL